jgi:hypothetical protein
LLLRKISLQVGTVLLILGQKDPFARVAFVKPFLKVEKRELLGKRIIFVSGEMSYLCVDIFVGKKKFEDEKKLIVKKALK